MPKSIDWLNFIYVNLGFITQIIIMYIYTSIDEIKQNNEINSIEDYAQEKPKKENSKTKIIFNGTQGQILEKNVNANIIKMNEDRTLEKSLEEHNANNFSEEIEKLKAADPKNK